MLCYTSYSPLASGKTLLRTCRTISLDLKKGSQQTKKVDMTVTAILNSWGILKNIIIYNNSSLFIVFNTCNSFLVWSISFIFVIFIFLLKNCANVKRIRTKLSKKSVFFTDKILRLSDKCEHNTWTISEGTTPTNNKRMVRHGTAPFACSSKPERSIWSPKDGIPCKSRQLQTRQILDWHSCIFVQVKESASLF